MPSRVPGGRDNRRLIVAALRGDGPLQGGLPGKDIYCRWPTDAFLLSNKVDFAGLVVQSTSVSMVKVLAHLATRRLGLPVLVLSFITLLQPAAAQHLVNGQVFTSALAIVDAPAPNRCVSSVLGAS